MKSNATGVYQKKSKVKGKQAKTKQSNNKKSKNYFKPNVGQGR